MTEGQCGVNLHSGGALIGVARMEMTKRGSVDREELSERKGEETRKEEMKRKEIEARERESWRRASPTCPTRSSIIVRDNSSRRDHLLSIRQVTPPRWARRRPWTANEADYNPGGRRLTTPADARIAARSCM